MGIATLADVELALNDDAPSESVRVADIVFTTVVAGLVAWAVHSYLVRRGLSRWWPVVATTVLIISMVGPIWYADGGSAVALIAMHVVVGVVLIGGFAVLSASRPVERRRADGRDSAHRMTS